MATHPEQADQPLGRFDLDEARWQALVDRDPAADGAFVYSVRTTGVYCRPACPSKLAHRRNVRFHATCRDAEAANFRPCRRCRPDLEGWTTRHADLVARACRAIEGLDEVPSLDDLARSVGMSPGHFHRTFRAETGLTPRGYAEAQRAERARRELDRRGGTITRAIYAAGFSSSGRFYESTGDMLGMTPGAYRAGGLGEVIRFAIAESWLGPTLVARSEKGVCAVLLGDDPDGLARDLQDRFPVAELIGDDEAFGQQVARVVAFVERPSIGLDLPLDIRGTAFQRRVWEALRQIPAGLTATYAEVARAIDRPGSTRAVAGACAANPLAVVVPCHRVVRSDGSLSGYRWGVDRKARLLDREREPSPG